MSRLLHITSPTGLGHLRVRLWNGSLTSLPRAEWTARPDDGTRVPTGPRTVLQVVAQFGFTRETNFGSCTGGPGSILGGSRMTRTVSWSADAAVAAIVRGLTGTRTRSQNSIRLRSTSQ